MKTTKQSLFSFSFFLLISVLSLDSAVAVEAPLTARPKTLLSRNHDIRIEKSFGAMALLPIAADFGASLQVSLLKTDYLTLDLFAHGGGIGGFLVGAYVLAGPVISLGTENVTLTLSSEAGAGMITLLDISQLEGIGMVQSAGLGFRVTESVVFKTELLVAHQLNFDRAIVFATGGVQVNFGKIYTSFEAMVPIGGITGTGFKRGEINGPKFLPIVQIGRSF